MKTIEKRSIIEFLGSRYRRANRKTKGVIIEEACERLWIGRRQARRLLGPKEPGRPRKPERRGRPSKYKDQ